MSRPLGVAVALEGHGWHPEAWRHTPERRSHLGSHHRVDAVTHARPSELAEAIATLDGVARGRAAIDLPFIVEDVMPRLRAAAGRRAAYVDGETLRERLGSTVATSSEEAARS